MPVQPVCLFEPLWVQFSTLLPERPRFSPAHPPGCHRERIADRVVFEHVIAAPVHGSGYERITSRGCSEGTIRRRVKEWAVAGLSEQLHTLALRAYDRMIGLELDDLAVDGCITKAPSGGAAAGRSPVDRGKQGLKRSVVTEATGIPLHLVSAGANRHDAPLLEPTLAGLDKLDRLPDAPTVHLDRAYDGGPTRALLDALGFDGAIARKGVPVPVQAGARWGVERTHQWMNGYGKLRRCTDSARPSLTPTSSSPPHPSSSARSSGAHAFATAGRHAPPPDGSSSPYCRSFLTRGCQFRGAVLDVITGAC